jgi:hypothetical protein
MLTLLYCQTLPAAGPCTTAGCQFRHDFDSSELLLLKDYYEFQETCKRQKQEKLHQQLLTQQQQSQGGQQLLQQGHVAYAMQATQQTVLQQHTQPVQHEVQHTPAAELPFSVDVEEI